MAIWGENSGLTPATRTEIVGVGVTGPLPASALREVVGVMCGCGFALNFIGGPMFQARSSMLRCDPSVLRFKVCLFRASGYAYATLLHSYPPPWVSENNNYIKDLSRLVLQYCIDSPD